MYDMFAESSGGGRSASGQTARLVPYLALPAKAARTSQLIAACHLGGTIHRAHLPDRRRDVPAPPRYALIPHGRVCARARLPFHDASKQPSVPRAQGVRRSACEARVLRNAPPAPGLGVPEGRGCDVPHAVAGSLARIRLISQSPPPTPSREGGDGRTHVRPSSRPPASTAAFSIKQPCQTQIPHTSALSSDLSRIGAVPLPMSRGLRDAARTLRVS